MTRRTMGWVVLAVLGVTAGQVRGTGLVLPSEVAQLRAEAIAAGRAYAFMIVGEKVTDVSDGVGDVGVVEGTDPGAPPAQVLPFGSSTTNLSAGPVTYSYLFGAPMKPAYYERASLTGSVTVTNGLGGRSVVDTSDVYPTYLSAYGLLGGEATNLGVDLGTVAVVVSGTPTGATTVLGFGTASNTFDLAYYDGLEVLLTYSQSDTSSVVEWATSATATPAVPEPAAALVGLGIVAAGRGRRRR